MAREMRQNRPASETPKEYEEVVLQVDRVSRTVKGGRRIRFRALVVIGNREGKVGVGIGKSAEVAGAVAKATIQAKKHLVNVPLIDGTIPHEATGQYGTARVLLKPAPEGTSVIAGSAVRTIADLSGIRNLVSKIVGSASKINIAEATLRALQNMQMREGKEKQ